MTHTIQLDLAFKNDIQELYDDFAKTEIGFKVLIEEGPGGGWPVCQLTAGENILEQWLLENYCVEDDLDFYMGREK